MKRYYVIAVKSGEEQTALFNLREQGFVVFNPLVLIRRVVRGVTVEQKVPLFAGYMFVKFDIARDRWRAVAHTKGVYQLITATNERCSPLPKGFVENLRRRCVGGCLIAEAQAVAVIRQFTVGDQVFVNSGVMEGLEGKVLKINKNSVTIIAALLNRSNLLSLPGVNLTHSAPNG